mgnify:CR=1 FL=1
MKKTFRLRKDKDMEINAEYLIADTVFFTGVAVLFICSIWVIVHFIKHPGYGCDKINKLKNIDSP